MVNAKVAQNTLVKLETDFPWVAVIHPLRFGVINILPGVLVFQLKGKHRYTIDGQHHINRIMALHRIKPLTITGDFILRIQISVFLIQARFRLEITYFESYAPVLETVPQNIQQTVSIAGIVKGQTKLFLRLHLILINKSGPGLGLGFLHKTN